MRTGVRQEEVGQIKRALAKGEESVEEIAQRFNVAVDVIESFVEAPQPEAEKKEEKKAE